MDAGAVQDAPGRARPRIGGRCDPAFRDLGRCFAERVVGTELGAALAVCVEGRLVVDLWGGWADRRRTRPWGRDTLACLFSATKGVAALAVLQAVERGRLALDVPLADGWPAFAGDGREAITLRHALTHAAGLIGFAPPGPFAFEDLYVPERAAAALAATRPWWAPGAAHGYHARTQGVLLDEALRRATDRGVGTWCAEHVAGPEDLELWIGLPEREHGRCAELVPAPPAGREDPKARALLQAMAEPGSETAAAFTRPPAPRGYANTAAFRSASLPAMNGHGTARALARLYGTLADTPERLLDPVLLAEATRPQCSGPDRVLGRESCFGLGFLLSREALPVGPVGTAFGHPGAGGTLAFADPARRLGFALLVNRMEPGAVAGGTTARALVDVLETLS